MRTNKILIATTLLSGILVLSSCSSGNKVSRIDAAEQIDLSGRWNETDSRQVAEAMVKDLVSRPWAMEFQANNDRKPTIVVGLIRNKSHEHISSETFTKDIERELTNSGRAKLVAGGDARNELREERADQQNFASKATAKEWGKELGADFIMQGTINSIVDSDGKSKVIFYQVDLELTSVETNEKVWIGDKKIKKFIKK